MNMGSPNRSPPRKLSNVSPGIGRTKSRDNDGTPNRTPNRSTSRGSMPQPQPQDLYQHYPNNSMVRMEENVGILGNSNSYYSSPPPPQRGTATRVMNGSAPPIGPHPSSFYNAGYGNTLYQPQRSPNPAAHTPSYYGQPYQHQPYNHHQQPAMHHQQSYPMSPNPQFHAARPASYYSPQTPPQQQPPNGRQSASPYAAGLPSQGSMMYMAPPLSSRSGSNHNLLAPRRSPSPVYNLQSRSGSPPGGRSRSPSPSRQPSSNNMSSSNNNLTANFQSGYFANAPANAPRSASSNNFYSASNLSAAEVAAVAAAAENGPAASRPGNQEEDYRVSLMIAEQERLLSEIARNRGRNAAGTSASSGTNSHNSSAQNLHALGSHPSRFGNQFSAPVPATATALNGGGGGGNGNNASLYRPGAAMNSSRNGSSNNLGAMAYGTNGANGNGTINAFRNTSNPNLGTVLGSNRAPANGGLMRPMLPPSNGPSALASPGPGPQVASPETARLESPRRAREFLQFQQQRQQQYQSPPPPSTRPSANNAHNSNVNAANANGGNANNHSAAGLGNGNGNGNMNINGSGNGNGNSSGGANGGENVVVPPSHRLASPAHRAPPPPSYMHQHPSSRYSDPKPAQFIARSLSQSRQLQRQAQNQLQESSGPAEVAARPNAPVIRRAPASPLPNSPAQAVSVTPPPPPPASPSQPQSPPQTQPRPAMAMSSVVPHMFHRRPLPPVVVAAQPVADDSVDHSDIHGDGDDEEVMYTNTAALSRYPTSPQSPPQSTPSTMGLASQSLPLGGDESVLSSGSQTPSVTSITQHNSGYGVNIPAPSLSRRPTIAALQMGFVNPLRRARSTKTPGGPTQRGSVQAANGSQQDSDAGALDDSDGGGVGESPATEDEKQRQRQQIREQLAINRATVASMRLQLNQASTD